MLRDTATCKANHERFINRIIESETVWYLGNDTGVAVCDSYDFDNAKVTLFFSDKAYANKVKKDSFPEFDAKSMLLFDFLFRWLTGMSDDGVVAGTNWTGDLVGLESDPQDLKEVIEKYMGSEMLDRYLADLDRQIKEQDSP